MIRFLLSLLLLVPGLASAAPFVSERIAVRVEGRGPDVVLVPGLGSSPQVWAATVKAVPGYRYHLVQVKGFAGVPAGANGTGPIVLPVADEIARYIAAAGLKAPALVGHSMGGTLVLAVAERHPAAAGRVMVVDMLPFLGAMLAAPGSEPTADSVRPTVQAMFAGMRTSSAEAYDARLVANNTAATRDPAQRAASLKDSRASDRTVVANAFEDLFTTDLRAGLAGIKVPVTVLYVTPAGVPLSDAAIDAAYAKAYAPVQGARLVRVPDSAHFIMSDNPLLFRRELATLLAR